MMSSVAIVPALIGSEYHTYEVSPCGNSFLGPLKLM